VDKHTHEPWHSVGTCFSSTSNNIQFCTPSNSTEKKKSKHWKCSIIMISIDRNKIVGKKICIPEIATHAFMKIDLVEYSWRWLFKANVENSACFNFFFFHHWIIHCCCCFCFTLFHWIHSSLKMTEGTKTRNWMKVAS